MGSALQLDVEVLVSPSSGECIISKTIKISVYHEAMVPEETARANHTCCCLSYQRIGRGGKEFRADKCHTHSGPFVNKDKLNLIR
jgi:hypothetical protein